MRATLGRWLAAAVAVVAVASPASAETIFGMKTDGEVETGARFFFVEPTDSRRGKFEEYRDIPEGLFLDRFRLRLFTPEEDYSVQLDGSKWGQEDQEFGLRAGRLGLWEFGFEWDQMRHIFSTTSQMLAVQQPKGVFTLPSPRPLLPTYNSAPGLDEISVRWDTARINLMFTPTPNLEFRAEYMRIDKHGDRPFSVAYGVPDNNFMEIAAPIDETVHDFRLKATLAYDRWQLQAAYTFSMYQNHLTSVTADNPCFGLTAAIAAGGCGAADGAPDAPSAGRVSLAPNNMAHAINLAGGLNLPFWNTRLTANVGYSVQLQNDTFLPHTINPAISSPLLTLPEDSLNGFVGIFLLNFNATTRPLRPLALTLKYRLFNRNDMSDDLDFPAHVINDRTLVAEERVAGRPDYTRQDLELDGRWRFGYPAAVTIGGGWEYWSRGSHRETSTSNEYFAKAALDITPVDWLLARLTYRPSFRRIGDYNTFAPQTTVVEDPSALAQGQSVLLRKFDEADRDRQQVSGLFQLTPLEGFTTSLTGDWRYDNYINSDLGLQQATSWSAGIDLNWTPVERLSIFGGYTYEHIFQKQRSRSRPVSGSTTLDFADFDWITDNTDTIDTFYAGAKIGLIPGVLDWTVNASYAYALGRMDTRNPVAPTSGTAAQNATATAQPFPAFQDQLLRVETALRYHFWKAWTASFGYVYESFQKNDWRTDRLNPFVPGVTSIWLGDDERNYDAHWVAFTLGYRF
jgi:MtrB/PioB family decaheme-associated outer membrane protein